MIKTLPDPFWSACTEWARSTTHGPHPWRRAGHNRSSAPSFPKCLCSASAPASTVGCRAVGARTLLPWGCGTPKSCGARLHPGLLLLRPPAGCQPHAPVTSPVCSAPRKSILTYWHCLRNWRDTVFEDFSSISLCFLHKYLDFAQHFFRNLFKIKTCLFSLLSPPWSCKHWKNYVLPGNRLVKLRSTRALLRLITFCW